MASTFTFVSPWSIHFGTGQANTIRQFLAPSRIPSTVLISDPTMVESGITPKIAADLESDGIVVHIYSDFESDPTAQSIDAAAAFIRETAPQNVIGLGGGSALDVTKLATALASSTLSAEDVALGTTDLPAKAAKLVLIPTTAGTGAEVTRTVVFTTTNHRKVWAWGDALAADTVILDPELTISLPPALTAATGLDALVHAIEACTNRTSNPFAQTLGLQAISLAQQHLLRAIDTPQDLEARGKMLLAATMAGMAIDAAGTGIAHCIGHALANMTRIHHGRAVALALDVVFNYNAKTAPEHHARVASALGVISTDSSDLQRAKQGASVIHALIRASGVPLSLQADGLGPQDAEQLVGLMLSDENRPMLNNNCYVPDRKALRHLAETLLTR